MSMMNVMTYVLAINGTGEPEFFLTNVDVTRDEYRLGEHYHFAKERAIAAGFCEPMQAFDEFDQAGKLLGRPIPKLMRYRRQMNPQTTPPTVLVWVDETGVQDVIADFPLRFVVVSTDTEYSEPECVFPITVGAHAKCKHEVVGYTSSGTVNVGEADSVWQQVHRFYQEVGE
jgi:hypothetical protein